MARFPSWNRCPPFYELADWLVTAELYSGDAPLRSASGPWDRSAEAAEWQQVDQADCAAAGLETTARGSSAPGSPVVGRVFNGRDTGQEFQHWRVLPFSGCGVDSPYR